MKLFLASLGLTKGLAPSFRKLLDNNRHSRKVPKGFIVENASDYKGKQGQLELHRYYEILKEFNLGYEFLDLRKYKNKTDQLKVTLDSADFIYISGGNIFYLYYWIVESGFDQIILEQINKGLVFAGSSAGSVIAGPTLKYMDFVDDISLSPEPQNTKWSGLGLVDFCILPHWGEEKYMAKFDQIKSELKKDNFQIRTLTNKQALLITNDKVQLINE